jgi:hypothetical protein
MELLGGFVGVTQDATTLALRPKLGWGVRSISELSRLLARISEHAPAPPLDGPHMDQQIRRLSGDRLLTLPRDFLSFYKRCNGVALFGGAHKAAHRFRPLAALFGGAHKAVYRFRPLEAVEHIWGIETGPPAIDAGPSNRSSRMAAEGLRFCDLADGSFVVVQLVNLAGPSGQVVRVGRPGHAGTLRGSVIARSFAEFLERALDSGGLLDTLDERKSVRKK